MFSKMQSTVLPDVPIIEVTKDFNQFNQLKGNRAVKPEHIRALMRSFTEFPGMRAAKPVLLNEKMEVIDGQHRIQAAIRLGLEIYYMIVPGLTITDARILNALQRSWSFLDYAESYAADPSSKYDAYRTYLVLRDEYPITPRALFSYTTSTGKSSSGGSERFKMGTYEPRSTEDIRKDLDMLEDFSTLCPWWKEQSFALAVLHLAHHKDYDHQRMLDQLKGKQLLHQADWVAYVRDMEIMYNTGNRKYIRFL